MTAPKTKGKWIIYRHEKSMDLSVETAFALKETAKGGLSKKDKLNILKNLNRSGLFLQRNQLLKLDSANHKINQLEAYMFGYQTKISQKKVQRHFL